MKGNVIDEAAGLVFLHIVIGIVIWLIAREIDYVLVLHNQSRHFSSGEYRSETSPTFAIRTSKQENWSIFMS